MSSVNGWELFAHPQLTAQLEKLAVAVERAKRKDPEGYKKTANAKVLAQLETLIWQTVPGDPTRPDYRQGATLGDDRKHWFRVKFGGGRFRLFFRYRQDLKIIVYAWVNDEDILRTYGAKTDAYAVFKSMLDKGKPPDDWPALIKEAVAMPVR
jgi:toxin YhaV